MMNEQKNEMAMEALKWIVSSIAENNQEAQKEALESGPEALFIHGRAEAYFEVMDILKSRLEILDVPIEVPESKAV